MAVLDFTNVSNIQSSQGFRLSFQTIHLFWESGANSAFPFPQYGSLESANVTIVGILWFKFDWKGVTNFYSK